MNKLKDIRTKKNYSFQTMARLLNISKTYYWQIEHGKRRLTYDLALRIADVFKTTPDNIFYSEYCDLEKTLKERK